MRIVSLAPSCTEILFTLGLRSEIVGVTKYCDYPLAAELIPKMGGWMDIDFSRVLAQKPDLVFTSTIVQQNVAERARELGLEVLHTDPRSLPEILESILQTGNAVGRTHRAEELVREICDDADNLRKKTEHLPKKKLYVEEWPLTVSGNWVPDLLEIAGATGIGKSGQLSFRVTPQDVAAFDPDAIVVSWCGFGTRVPLQKITERTGFRNLRAVKNRQVFVLDDTLLNRPGPRIIAGAHALARSIHGI
ncbi:cobalamin-binding protein [Candidatus Woesearchaeota archaeon]|nr:MAG: cobalamin-binding protein [Candidatus Woesearchaeota archaeon]